jgi:hypothetical protein
MYISPEYQILGHLPQTPQASWFHQSSPAHWLLEQMVHAPSAHKQIMNTVFLYPSSGLVTLGAKQQCLQPIANNAYF